MMMTLHNKVALITGSSTGLGAAIAKELSARGANVIIHYAFPTEEPLARKVQSSLAEGTRSILVQADLSTITGARNLADAAAKEFGRVDILVNNAGVSALDQFVPDTETTDTDTDMDTVLDKMTSTWDQVVNVNGRGTLLLTRAILPILSRNGSRIINIGSTTSRDPDPGLSIYAGSKGMIEAFTRCWARYLPREYGCTVNTVAPGPIATEKMLSLPREFLDAVGERCRGVPVAARMGEPGEVAWVVAALCEERAGWLNGLFIPVAGGGFLG